MIINCVKRALKFRKCRLIFIAALVSIFCKFYFDSPSVDNLLELNKCPTCYGFSACNFIREVDIIPRDFYSLFAYYFGVKNVFFGEHRGRKIVLKKLAQREELKLFDKTICEDRNFRKLCPENYEKNSERTINFDEFIEEEIRQDIEKDFQKRLILCPGVENLHKLFRNVYENDRDLDIKTVDTNVWTLLKINPEPLVLQILPAENGWPVPKYFGSCGRIILEEYVGPSLNSFFQKPWIEKAKIAASLLKAAYNFTFSNEDFAFYLTDVSWDNIAVNDENIGKFVDLENVIVVDKNSYGLNQWELQENRIESTCSDNLIFSTGEICRHRSSDHNFYAICQILWVPEGCGKWTSGFLQDVPSTITDKFPRLKYLLDQCVIPDSSENRISIGQELQKLLETI